MEANRSHFATLEDQGDLTPQVAVKEDFRQAVHVAQGSFFLRDGTLLELQKQAQVLSKREYFPQRGENEEPTEGRTGKMERALIASSERVWVQFPTPMHVVSQNHL